MKKKYIIANVVLLMLLIAYLYPTPRHTFKELYKGSEDDKLALLDSVRALPLKSVTIDGKQWNYLAAGNGKESIIFLHGMAGGYDIWWQQISAFKNKYRIITLTYPPAGSLSEMGNAVIKILDNENIASTNVLGSSLGGYFAQYLKTTYPDRFKKAVFANTFPPNSIYKEKNGTTASIARFLPEWLVMVAFRGNIRSKVIPTSENSPLAEAYLLEQSYGGMSKKQFLSRYLCVVDSFVPSKELTSSNDILLIESDNDPLIFPELRQQLKELYPAARLYTFKGKGHFPYLNETGQYNKVIGEFFESSGMEVFYNR
ncbi:MAG: alpha/beta hydrolase [Cyclobacteriaceae bacterium]|nr:alpha/beta hydrolase [Cyclobacteriaceae bacterium]